MKTLVNKQNPQIRIIAPEIVLSVNKEEYWVAGIPQIPRTYLAKEWILVEDEPKHTEVWVEGRTIFEQDTNTFVNTEEEPEVKHIGWVARDEDERIWVYETCPKRYSDWQQWVGNEGSMALDKESFPNIKWEDEPVEVEITIRKK